MTIKQQTLVELAVCIRNEGYAASLERRKLYQVIPGLEAAKRHQLRVMDESGEDYLYPEAFFVLVRLPKSVEQTIIAAA